MQIPVRSRRQFLKALGVGAVSLAAPGCMTALGRSTRKPNIVFILADDMGFNDISLYNGETTSTIPTPEIDSLAAQGVVFTNGYAANATCAPSRAALEAESASRLASGPAEILASRASAAARLSPSKSTGL